jgi:hypothetical protein
VTVCQRHDVVAPAAQHQRRVHGFVAGGERGQPLVAHSQP